MHRSEHCFAIKIPDGVVADNQRLACAADGFDFFARALKNARKAMIKFYGSPENIVEPSDDAFKAAEALPDDTFTHQLEKKRTVKKLVNEKSKYIRSVKPLLDARRQLTEKENYAHLDDIRARYADAKANTDAEYEARRVEIERLEEARKADLERRKQERLAKKNGK